MRRGARAPDGCLGPLGRDRALGAGVPEQHWRLAPPPPGWEAMRDPWRRGLIPAG
jgi:hypothetical protein